jgi:surface antigen
MARVRSLVLVIAAGASALAGSVSAASAQTESVSQARVQLNQAQAKLNALNDQVEKAQAALDDANRQLDQDRAQEATVDKQLGDIARYQYMQPALPIVILRSGSLREALGDLSQWRVVGEREQALLNQRKAIRIRDQKAHDQIQASLKSVQDAQAQAKQVAAQAQANLTSAQAEEYRQLAAMAAATAVPAGVNGSWPNHFSYGYCTWYVANKRYIPWYGNAIEWWPNAQSYGYAEGQAPAVGAVMVTRESSAGHVAYVESVNGDGSWTVTEMNYTGWGQVDRRTLRPGQVSLVGFIYGKA